MRGWQVSKVVVSSRFHGRRDYVPIDGYEFVEELGDSKEWKWDFGDVRPPYRCIGGLRFQGYWFRVRG